MSVQPQGRLPDSRACSERAQQLGHSQERSYLPPDPQLSLKSEKVQKVAAFHASRCWTDPRPAKLTSQAYYGLAARMQASPPGVICSHIIIRAQIANKAALSFRTSAPRRERERFYRWQSNVPEQHAKVRGQHADSGRLRISRLGCASAFLGFSHFLTNSLSDESWVLTGSPKPFTSPRR